MMTKPAFPDFYIQGEIRQFVVAAYPLSPDIVKREDPALVGVPFLFYVGLTRGELFRIRLMRGEEEYKLYKNIYTQIYANARALAQIGGIPEFFLGSKKDLYQMLKGTVRGRDIDPSVMYPKSIEVIPGKIVNRDDILNYLTTGKNPPSFRTEADYRHMIKVILPDVLAERKCREAQIREQEANAPTLGSKVRTLYGLCQQKTDAYEPKVPAHYDWK